MTQLSKQTRNPQASGAAHRAILTPLANLYRRARWILSRKPYRYRTAHPIRRIDPDAANSFFGYYDKCPLNPTQELLIYHTSGVRTFRAPNPSQPVTIVIKRRDHGDIVHRLASSAYNWQQGTRAQWISPTRIIYNDYDATSDRYVSRIFDASTQRQVGELQLPIYDSFGDNFALTLNFRRLACLSPDYGYFSHRNIDIHNDYDNDGIWIINLHTGRHYLILSLSTIVSLQGSSGPQAGDHSVNHIMISPAGRKFIAIHRWYVHGKRRDRLLLANVDGTGPTILADEAMVSHCCWMDETHLLGYLRRGGVDAYYVIDTEAEAAVRLGGTGISQHGDGHPSVHGSFVLFDTYPNRSRMQRLFLFDMRSKAEVSLGELYEPLRFRGVSRCDLHPRFSRDGNSIFFDSAHDGSRQMYEMKLSDCASAKLPVGGLSALKARQRGGCRSSP